MADWGQYSQCGENRERWEEMRPRIVYLGSPSPYVAVLLAYTRNHFSPVAHVHQGPSKKQQRPILS